MADLLIPKRVGKDKFLLSDFQHDFDEINKEILDLANKDELNKTLADLESNLNQKINKSKEEMASDYNSKINEVEKQVDTNRAELDDLKDEVTFKASKEDVSVVKSEIIDDYNKKFDTINTQIEEEKSQLEVLNDKIELKVEKNELDSLETKLQGEIDSTNGTLDEKIRQNSSAIELLNNEIQLKVTQSDIHNVKTEIQNEFGEQVSTINSTINEHSSSIDMLSNKIELKVESTDLEELKTTIGTDVDSKVTDIQTQVQQNSAAITALSNEITLQVKQETADVATMSELTQTANSLEIKFTNVNANNILRNGAFRNGMTYWWRGAYGMTGSGHVEEVWDDSNEWVLDNTLALVMRSNNMTGGEYRIDSAKMPVKKNTDYTLSYLVSAHRVDEIGHYIRGNEWDVITSRRYVPLEGGKDRNNWTKIVHTFNTGDNYQISINFIHFKTGENAHSWYTEVMINEGTVALPYQPHPEEIYSGSTWIDKDGITVKNGALTIKNNAGESVFYADTSGNLTLQGKVVNGDGTYSTTIEKGGLVFTTGGERVAGIRSTKFTSANEINGISISAMKHGDYVDLGYTDSDTLDASAEFTPYLRLSKTYNDKIGNFVGIQLKEHTRLDKGRTFHMLGSTAYTGEIFVNTEERIAIIGDNGVNIGYKVGDNKLSSLSIIEGTGIKAYDNLDMSGYSINNVANIGSVEPKATRISNINAILPSGWYSFGDDAAGSPPVNWGAMLVLKAFVSGDNTDFCQVIFGTNNTVYCRWWANNSYSSWKNLG